MTAWMTSASSITSSRIRLLTSCSRQRRTTLLVLFVSGVVFGQVSIHFIIPRVPGGNSSWCGYLLESPSSGTSGAVSHDVDTTTDKRNRQTALRQGPDIDGPALSTHQTPELLFVGVMTSRRYLRTRARAIHETWGRAAQLDGASLVFFVGGGDNVTDSDMDGPPLRVQILPEVVDSEYPPRRKSFAMLDWMHRNYGQRYDWFMRADDDLFVDVVRLRALLSSMDGSSLLYLGHPGTGKAGEEGKLGLLSGAPYCMGGTGVLVSRGMLESLAGKLSGCLENTASDHEDSELGRCVYNVTGVACVQSERIYRRFKQNYDDTSGEWIRRALSTPRAYVTFHPVKDTRYMYQSATLVETQRVVKLRKKVRRLESDIACLQEMIRVSQPVSGNGQTPIGSEMEEVEEGKEEEQKGEDAAEKFCSDGKCSENSASWQVPACELGKRRLRIPPRTRRPPSYSNVSLRPGTDDSSEALPWSLMHAGTFHALWTTGFVTHPAGYAGVSEGLTLMLRHLSNYVSAESRRKPAREGGSVRDLRRPSRSRARQRSSSRRSRLVAVDHFYRRVWPGVGVEYVTFVRSGKSKRLRPYVVREEFDTPVAVEKQGEPVNHFNADEKLTKINGRSVTLVETDV